MILEYSTKPLSLRRVPPNLLVGPGATDFAEAVGVPVLPADCLISQGARGRWMKWIEDLKAAEIKGEEIANVSEISENRSESGISQQESEAARHLAPFWNESQPYSPHPSATQTPANNNTPRTASPQSR